MTDNAIETTVTIDLWINNLAELERLARIADEENGLFHQDYTPDQAFAIAVNNATLSAQAFKCLEGWVATPKTGWLAISEKPFEKQEIPGSEKGEA